MYERFTDRARKSMQLANQEARNLNHEYVGTEHMVLGISTDSGCMAAIILQNLGVTRDKLREEVLKLVQAGPEIVTIGKLPHTPRAKKAVDLSMEEARTLNHNWIGTEHILLGLIREGEGVAALILKTLGVTLDAVRFQIMSLVESQAAKPSILTPVGEALASKLQEMLDGSKAWHSSVTVATPPLDKPPLGVKPRRIHAHERAQELIDGCCRFIHAGQVPHENWLVELRELIDDMANC